MSFIQYYYNYYLLSFSEFYLQFLSNCFLATHSGFISNCMRIPVIAVLCLFVKPLHSVFRFNISIETIETLSSTFCFSPIIRLCFGLESQTCVQNTSYIRCNETKTSSQSFKLRVFESKVVYNLFSLYECNVMKTKSKPKFLFSFFSFIAYHFGVIFLYIPFYI